MKVIVFGATGMIGQGVVRECIRDAQVTRVLTVGRAPFTPKGGNADPKVHDLVHKDLFDLASVADKLTGYDACFWCLGVSSSGMSEADYTRITHDLTLSAAKVMLERNPNLKLVFVSGASTDGSETSGPMWARVKGKTENALFKMPFSAVYAVRPAMIEPKDGITSRTTGYRVFYTLMRPFFPLVHALAPKSLTTTERVGRAMLVLVTKGSEKRVLENDDLNTLGAA